MSGIRVFVTLPDPDARPSDLGLGDAGLVDEQYHTWELAAAPSSLALVFDLVSRKLLVSAYVSKAQMPGDKPWLACEWHGRVVSDPQTAQELRGLFSDWLSKRLEKHGLVIFSPPYLDPREAARRAYRDHLNDEAPLFLEADFDDVRANPQDWFGEYAGPGAAGWVTLFSASMVNHDGGLIALGNLSALGFRKSAADDSLWSAVKLGIISAKAIGISRDQLHEDWTGNAGFRLARHDFVLDGFEQSMASYAVAVEIEAVIDPKVIIGSGTVFEQLSPGHAQNLSVAQEWHNTIDAGQILGVVLPAYCLNQTMAAPSGEPLQLTPLAFAGNSENQDDVWRDIAGRRKTGDRR